MLLDKSYNGHKLNLFVDMINIIAIDKTFTLNIVLKS